MNTAPARSLNARNPIYLDLTLPGESAGSAAAHLLRTRPALGTA